MPRIISIPRDGFLLLRTPPFVFNTFSDCPRERVTIRAIFNPSRLKKESSMPPTPIQSAARLFDAHLTGRFPCPDCGNVGPHDDNGGTGANLSFCCAGCGIHIDADQVEVDDQ
jgi:hypothetical protein